jgi:hypothetical protein
VVAIADTSEHLLGFRSQVKVMCKLTRPDRAEAKQVVL